MLLGQLVLLSERSLSQVIEESWVVVAELGNAVSETFTLLDRHESEVVALSALVVAGIMHVLVKASQHGKSLPSNIMHVQWIVLQFLNIYRHYQINLLVASPMSSPLGQNSQTLLHFILGKPF